MINEGYSICYNEWALDNRIKNELGLLLIIASLSAEQGYCWAGNKYFAELFNEPTNTISRKIKRLETLGYIKAEYKKSGNVVVTRKLTITNLSRTQNCVPPYSKMSTAVLKNVKEKNINNKIINNKNIDNRFFSDNVIDLDRYYANLED